MTDMLQHRLRRYIVVLVLVAFTGQVGAAVPAPCSMMHAGSSLDNSGSVMVHGDMGHSDMRVGHLQSAGHGEAVKHAGSAARGAADTPECCDQAQCSPVHCMSGGGAALVSTTLPAVSSFCKVLNAGGSASCVLAEGSSLLRPPIFR